MSDANCWCDVLGIDVPCLSEATKSARKSPYRLLLVALLERGAPMTLEQVAARFEEAGLGKQKQALATLKRCQPGRPPVYREGELYSLDPHDKELDLWAFRLGLRPAKGPAISLVPEPTPEPRDPHAPLTVEELAQAWGGSSLTNWSAQRLVIAVLDAHGGPMQPVEVVSFVESSAGWHSLTVDSDSFKRRNSQVLTQEDGCWAIPADCPGLLPTRAAVRGRLAVDKSRGWQRTDPSVFKAHQLAVQRARDKRAVELAALKRVILHSFPVKAPELVVLVDVAGPSLMTFRPDSFDELRERLAEYDAIAGVDIRAALRALEYEWAEQRVQEIGPSQKTITVGDRGKKLKITMPLIISSSCNIPRPLGDPKVMQGYVDKQQTARLQKRLELDARSLHALYQYSRLHGVVRVCHGNLDAEVLAPWVHSEEREFRGLLTQALSRGIPLEVVLGRAPDWEDPWARVRRFQVWRAPGQHWESLYDGEGRPIDELDVQAARMPS